MQRSSHDTHDQNKLADSEDLDYCIVNSESEDEHGFVTIEETTKKILSALRINSDARRRTKRLYTGKKDPQCPDLPLRARHRNRYQKQTTHESRSAHEVDIVLKNELARFLKHNTREKDPQGLMSQLEAVNAGFYQLIIPKHVPSTRAIYDDNHDMMDVCSNAVPGFKSIIDDPLTEDDLKIPLLEAGLLDLSMLEKLDEWTRCANIDLSSYIDEDVDGVFIDGENDKNLEEIRAKIHLCEAWFANPSTDPQDGHRVILKQLINLIHRDLNNFRIVKGLAECLAASVIFEEDDLHRKNMSKYGFRIDFDMSQWRRLYAFKYMAGAAWYDRYLRSTSSATSLGFRQPGSRFDMSAGDIEHLPNLQTYNPYYFVTKGQPLLPESIAQYFSENGFTSKDHAVFQLLEKHPVFVYYKYRTFLKYALTCGDMYQDIGELNMCKNIVHEETGKTFVNLFADDQEENIRKCENLLLELPSFTSFMEEHGDRAFAEIMAEFQERQTALEEKAKSDPAYQEYAYDYLPSIRNKYARIKSLALQGCVVKIHGESTEKDLPKSLFTQRL